MDVPRGLAKEADDPNCVVLAEREINDYLKTEIDHFESCDCRRMALTLRRQSFCHGARCEMTSSTEFGG